jgi:hypothetical protein
VLSAPAYGLDAETILRGGGIPGQPSVFISKRAYQHLGDLREDLYYTMDWEYWVRLGLAYPEGEVCLIDELLSLFNGWQGGKTQSGVGADQIEKRRVLRELYARSDLPVRYQATAWQAFTASYFRQARSLAEAKRLIRALWYYLLAFFREPFKYHPVMIARNIADALLQEDQKNKIKKRLRMS